VLFYGELPVDIRHNAKINREMLAAWAADRLDADETSRSAALTRSRAERRDEA
jgi:hypothetical protein